jgi:hypothetical protein
MTSDAECGTSVSQFVAELVNTEPEPVVVDPAEIEELERRWAAVELSGATVPHEKVERWLQTWVTPAFRPPILVSCAVRAQPRS